MALHFEGVYASASQKSCKCDPSQQGKCDEGFGFNFSFD